MKMVCKWNEKMKLSAEAEGHKIDMDARSPVGSDSAMTPKHLLLAAVAGCTSMDVVALLKKYKQGFEAIEIDVDGPMTEGTYPTVFKEIKLDFKIEGNVDPAKALEAVKLSQTKYCGVTAMVSKAVPVNYTVTVNGEFAGTGKAQFND